MLQQLGFQFITQASRFHGREASGEQILRIAKKPEGLGYPALEYLGNVDTNGLWKRQGKTDNAFGLLLTCRKARVSSPHHSS